MLAFGLAVLPVAAVAPAADASGAQCVALVVDRAPGSYATNCVSWAAGITGLDVLRRAGHAIQFRQDGLVCQIDGYPGGACAADATHYWSYWHRAPGSSGWTYSALGPASYQPPVGATEGWAYLNGATRVPASVAFSTICPPPPTTAPRTTAPPGPPPARTSTRATTAPSAGGGPAQHSTAGTSRAAPTRPAAATSTSAARTARTGPPNTQGSAGTQSPSATPVAALVSPTSTDRSSGSPVGLLAGLVLVGGIAGAAVWHAHSRRGPT